ncbi:hypothetical protein PUNSTDRAFT_96714 [Punctularia strigosozonata HHB-11173 SS5]|uniref:uncharacterized protein n=1 Tax=Punctularia strigosozonata (strain HHB-11173) TaxID=741275 RepID=UPI00044176EB|nr:uncharacterized protein PUNSTDRAFT_96714 [Punctularia strigosozonata HHB-11173 SS5]EIN14686.1 hypothetical protein PUNSTDRAFT_96714 [Punctularia strigosozonata HHB-11173 SS5]
MLRLVASVAFATLASLPSIRALGQSGCVSFSSSGSHFSVVSGGKAAPIILSDDEWPGVQRAALDFASDIHAVTGHRPSLSNFTGTASGTPIIVGTLGKSSLIDQVVKNSGLDVSSINGTWEAWISKVVKNPLEGVNSAFVIVGSDKRASIYGLYDLSEQFGQSPWYYWADVPVSSHSSLFVDTAGGCSSGSPSVQYRGIFLNDEQPALQNWAQEKFASAGVGPRTGSPFNHVFYSKLFELILRLKGNYFWPAQWSSAFQIDDPINMFTADMYGIVMGTSHEEPMMRSIPVEWDLFGVGPWDYSTNQQFIYNFWVNSTERSAPYESLFTVGMRGNGDLPLGEGQNIQLLEQVVADQRTILSTVFNTSDVAQIPQVWTLYKEVQGYYEDGMTVPDDICLMWTDDNWGNIRRYPINNETDRSGGAGVYYHVDYVGSPRDYKWIQSSQISKIFEQMSLAIERNATRIWILNVGDLKPYEMDTEFFLAYGWNASRWDIANMDTFMTSWAQREFDLSAAKAQEVVDILSTVKRFNARRKPELLNSTTYSLIDYREAESVAATWDNLTAQSTAIYNSLPSSVQPAFFQLVHHEVLASATVGKMWISAGINNMRAQQARLSTNDMADTVEDLFAQDYDLEHEYHTILNGKWDHMMDQTHVMYYYWQQPDANTMPPITRVQSKKMNLAGVMRITPEGTYGTWPGDNKNQCAQGYGCPNPTITLDTFMPFGNKYIDVSAGGPDSFNFTATTNASWLKLSPSSGSITSTKNEQRVFASVDWDQLEDSTGEAIITFSATSKTQSALQVRMTVLANHTSVPAGFKGFVEGDGGISMEAAHATRNTSVDGVTWTTIPNYGRTLSGVTPWPRTGANGRNFSAGSGPSLEYDFYNFNTIGGSGKLSVTTLVSPSMNANGDDRPLSLAVQLDDSAPQATKFMPLAAAGATPDGWDGLDGFVANSIVQVKNTFTGIAPGAHTLKVWMIEPAVVVQKLVIDTGNVRPSYLGPPESTII